MRIKLLVLSLFTATVVGLTGCDQEEEPVPTLSSEEQEKQEKLEADYAYFTSLDFSDELLYYDKNYYTYENEEGINWYGILHEQNQNFSQSMLKLNSRYKSIDDSNVKLENGVKSYLTLTYDDNVHPVATLEIPVLYLDATKHLDGTPSSLIPRRHMFTDRITINGKDYKVEFKSYDDDYYGLWFSHLSDDVNVTRGGYSIANEDYRYNHKYTGVKTYDIGGTPAAKVWKDKMGYRVTLLDSESSDDTEYYVYSVDLDNSSHSWFLSRWHEDYLLRLYKFYSDLTYGINYIEYNDDLQTLEIKLQTLNENETVIFDQTFTLNDYYTQTISKEELDYDIELTRAGQRVVTITFIHKELDDYVFSYTLEANKTK